MMADLAAELLRAFAHEPRALDVVGGGAVREVEAHDVDARGEHARHDGGGAACRAERCDDLGVARHDESLRCRAGNVTARVYPAARDSRIATAGSVLPFEELEERAAPGRDVADPVGEAELGDRGDRVAAAGDRERVATRRSPRAIAFVPPANASNSNTPTGPFQTMVPARAMIILQRGDRRRADIENQVVGVDVLDRLSVGVRASPRTPSRPRRRPGSAPCPGNSSRMAFASPTRSRLDERLADVAARGQDERVGDAAADDQHVDLRRERAQDRELGRHFRSGDDRDQRTLRIARARWPSASSSAASSGPAHATGAIFGDAVRRRLGAMRRAEGVVDVDVAQRRHLSRERVVVLLLALVEAAVLEQHDLPRLQRVEPRAAVDPVAHERHRHAEQLGQALRDRRQRVLGLPLAFGRPAEMRGHHHRRAARERVADARAPRRECACRR